VSPAEDQSRSRSKRRELWAVAGCLFALAIAIFAQGARLNRYHTFLSPDSGARYVMVRNFVRFDSVVYLHYANADVDTEGRLSALGLVTERHTPDALLLRLRKGFCTVFLPLFPLLSAQAYRLFGFGGLTLIPALAGLAAVAVTYLLALRLGLACRLPLLIALGAASPLFIYSCLFWDHTLHMLCSALAALGLFASLRSGRLLPAILAGVALGAGLLIHELLGIMWIALMLAGICLWRDPSARRALGGLLLGFAPLAALFAATNFAMYGIVTGPLPTIAENILAIGNERHFISAPDISDRLLSQTLGYDPIWGWLAPALLVAFAVAYLIALKLGGRALRLTPLLLVPLAVLGFGHMVGVQTRAQSGYGLALGAFETTPILLAAFAFAAIRQKESESAGHVAFYKWTGLACCFLILLVSIAPPGPGINWGGRFVLTALPMWALLAARVLEGNGMALSGRYRTAFAASACMAVAVGLYSNYVGVRAIRIELAAMAERNRAILAIRSPAIVNDNWLWGMGLTEPGRNRQFLVRDYPQDAELMYRALSRLGIREFVFVGKPEDEGRLRDAAPARERFIIADVLPPPATGVRFLRVPQQQEAVSPSNRP
jgi:hypothetical protein